MRTSILADRYARALYALAKEADAQDTIFDDMRLLDEAFKTPEIAAFLFSPVVRPADKVGALEKMCAGMTISQVLKNFILLLAKKSRLGLFKNIGAAFEKIADENNSVTRGTVRSATVLGSDERKRIETLVARATGKQVILHYKEDASLVGGLVAEVGSFTFDDSLTSHLKRINEQLTRVRN